MEVCGEVRQTQRGERREREAEKITEEQKGLSTDGMKCRIGEGEKTG